MQTDAYDPKMMSLFLAAENDRQAAGSAPDFGLDGLREPQDQPTAPIDMAGWISERDDEPQGAGPAPALPADQQATAVEPADEDDLRDEAQRATRAALRRWGATDDDGARLGQGV
jgi:hypothetical protein